MKVSEMFATKLNPLDVGTHTRYTFPFTTKEEYLAWRKQWRETYRELSQAIREYRQTGRNVQSVQDKKVYRMDPQLCKMERYLYSFQPYQQQLDKDPTVIELSQKHKVAMERLKHVNDGKVWDCKVMATELLLIRKASKVEAQRQYLAQKGANNEVSTEKSIVG